MHALGLELGSAAQLSKRPGSVWNCLWGNALKRSPGIIRKSRVSYPGPGYLSSATWPSLPKKHYNGLNQTNQNMTINTQPHGLINWSSTWKSKHENQHTASQTDQLELNLKIKTWQSTHSLTDWSTGAQPENQNMTINTQPHRLINWSSTWKSKHDNQHTASQTDQLWLNLKIKTWQSTHSLTDWSTVAQPENQNMTINTQSHRLINWSSTWKLKHDNQHTASQTDQLELNLKIKTWQSTHSLTDWSTGAQPENQNMTINTQPHRLINWSSTWKSKHDNQHTASQTDQLELNLKIKTWQSTHSLTDWSTGAQPENQNMTINTQPHRLINWSLTWKSKHENQHTASQTDQLELNLKIKTWQSTHSLTDWSTGAQPENQNMTINTQPHRLINWSLTWKSKHDNQHTASQTDQLELNLKIKTWESTHSLTDWSTGAQPENQNMTINTQPHRLINWSLTHCPRVSPWRDVKTSLGSRVSLWGVKTISSESRVSTTGVIVFLPPNPACLLQWTRNVYSRSALMMSWYTVYKALCWQQPIKIRLLWSTESNYVDKLC